MFLSSVLILKSVSVIHPLTDMSFLQKLMKRKVPDTKKPTVTVEDPETREPTEVADENTLSDRLSVISQSGDTNSDTDSEDERQKEAIVNEMGRQLKSMNRHQERRRRRYNEVMAMEAEIQELISIISRCQTDCKALDEEVMNKKCEMKFLQTEGNTLGLDNHEMHLQVKKNQPAMYKKYNNIKGSNEAKNLLTVIRNSQRALQYLELMTYNRLLERQHGLHLDPVRKRTNLLLKDKAKNFGHLVDSVRPKKLSLKNNGTRCSSPVQTDTPEANAGSDITHVTVTSAPTSPTLAPNVFGFGPMFGLSQDTTANALFGNVIPSGQVSGQPRIPPVNPFETAL